MRTALKEWAVVVDALGRGEQIVILRKGGILEKRDGFQVEHPSFLLFPTLFHQQRESVIPSAQVRYDQMVRQLPPPDRVRIEFLAEVAHARRLDTLSAAESLRGQHVWTNAVIASRYDWGQARNIHALALRVHRLPHPLELPVLPQYGGCTSWIELEQDLPVAGAQPVLDQAAFDHKLQQMLSALNS
ncbi:MAG: hypothetical protein RJA22_2521 [Verrucomicrobiota bacterium]|jgi:hypothetical protein